MYLWLKQDAEKQLKDLESQGVVGSMRIETDRISGKKYIDTYGGVNDPTNEIPNALGDLIESVTAKERIVRGFQTQGVYLHDGVTLRVRIETRFHDGHRDTWQFVEIIGPSVKTVMTSYSLLRQGKLTPEENWDELVAEVEDDAEQASD